MSILDEVKYRLENGKAIEADLRIARAADRAAERAPKFFTPTEYGQAQQERTGGRKLEGNMLGDDERFQQDMARIKQSNEMLQEGGLGGYKNMSSDNPVVSGLAHAINLGQKAGAVVAGGFLDLADYTFNSSNIANETSAIGEDMINLYNREKQADEAPKFADLASRMRAAPTQFIGYDKKYKTISEFEAALAEADRKAAISITDEERASLDGTSMALDVRADGLTYRQAIERVQKRIKVSEGIAGNRSKGKDDLLGTDNWGSQAGRQKFARSMDENLSDETKAMAEEGKQQFADGNYRQALGNLSRAAGATALEVPNAMNLQFFGETAAEFVPQLLRSTAAPVMLGDTARVYGEGLKNSPDETMEGDIPTAADSLRAASAAAVYTGLNYAERAIAVGALKGKNVFSRGDRPDAPTPTGNLDEVARRNAMRNTFNEAPEPTRMRGALDKAAGAAGYATRVTGATLGAAAAEGVTEGLQEYVEGVAGGDWNPDAIQIGTAAGVGGMMGGAIRTVGEVGKQASKLRGNREVAEEVDTTDYTLDNNDTPFTDEAISRTSPDNDNYDPVRGVQKIVEESTQPDSVISREQTEEVIGRVEKDLESQYKAINTRMEAAKAGVPALEARIAKGKGLIEALAEDDPNYELKQKFYSNTVSNLESVLEQITEEGYKAENDQAMIDEVNEKILQVAESAGLYREYANAAEIRKQKETAKDEPIADIKANSEESANVAGSANTDIPSTANDEQGTDRVDQPVQTDESVNTEAAPEAAAEPTPVQAEEAPKHKDENDADLYMKAPSKDNIRQMELLFDSPNIPEPKRTALRAVHDALLKSNREKTPTKVSDNVRRGDTQYRGAEQYIGEMDAAIKKGDQKTQQSLMSQHNSFAQSRESKLRAIEAAQAKADETGKIQQVVKPKNSNNWFVSEVRVPPSEFKKNNGIEVNPAGGKKPDTSNLQRYIREDIEIIRSTGTALQAMVDADVKPNSLKSAAKDEFSDAAFENFATQVESGEIEIDAIEPIAVSEQQIPDDTTVPVEPVAPVEADAATQTVESFEPTAAPEPVQEVEGGIETANVQQLEPAEPNRSGDSFQGISYEALRLVRTVQDIANYRVDNGDLILTSEPNKAGSTTHFTMNGVTKDSNYTKVDGTKYAVIAGATDTASKNKMHGMSPTDTFFWNDENDGGVRVSNPTIVMPEGDANAERFTADGFNVVTYPPAENAQENYDNMANAIEANFKENNIPFNEVDLWGWKDKGMPTPNEREDLAIAMGGNVNTPSSFENSVDRELDNIQSIARGIQKDAATVNSKSALADLENTDEQGLDERIKEVTKRYKDAIQYVKENIPHAVSAYESKVEGLMYELNKVTAPRIAELRKPKATKPKSEPKVKLEGNPTKATTTETAPTPADNNTIQEAELFEEPVQDAAQFKDEHELNEDIKDEAPKPSLAVLQIESKSDLAEERAKPITEQNLVRTGFSQKISKKGSNSLLTNSADTLGLFSRNEPEMPIEIANQVIEYYTGKPATEEQAKQLVDFHEFGRGTAANDLGLVNRIMKASAVNKDARYNYKRPINFLLDQNGELDEVAAIAVSAAIYTWLAENGDFKVLNKKQVARMLHIKNEGMLRADAYNYLADMGTHQETLASALGQRVMTMLQLDLNRNVDPVRASAIEQALGTLAVGVMIDANLAERTFVKHSTLVELAQDTNANEHDQRTRDQGLRKDATKVKDGFHSYIRPTKQNKIPNRVYDTARSTGSMMSDVFGYTPQRRPVTLEPVKSVPQTYGKFKSKTPKHTQEAIDAVQNAAYRLDTPIVDLTLNIMDTGSTEERTALLRALGAKDLTGVHEYYAKSYESINTGILRGLDTLRSTKEATQGKDFYLTAAIWPNSRIGITSEFNPQSDTMHRGFSTLSTDGFSVNVSAKPIHNGKLTSYGNFLRAIGFRIEDVKMENQAVDKTTLARFIPAIDAYINSDEVKAATAALDRLMTNNKQDGDIATVMGLLERWEMGSRGLSALNAIKDLHNARNTGKKSFTAYVPADSDGLVNGPAITSIMMMHANRAFYDSVGFVSPRTAGQVPFKSMQEWKEIAGNKDPYEALAESQLYHWEREKAVADDMTFNAMKWLDFYDDAFGERKGAKRALTPFNYGSELDAINRANAAEFVDAVYKHIDKHGGHPNLTAGINDLITYYNHRLRNGAPPVKLVTDAELADRTKLLRPAVHSALFAVDMALRGKATREAFKSTMAEYKGIRDNMNEMSNASFEIFSALYNAAVTQAVENKKQRIKNGTALKGEVILETKGGIIESLTKVELQAVINRLMPYMPKLNNPAAPNDKDSAIILGDRINSWDGPLTVEVVFNALFADKLTEKSERPINASKGSTTTVRSGTRKVSLEAPGTSTLALFIQAMDSYVTQQVVKAVKAQNYHDANSGNVTTLEEMARIQNKAILKAMSEINMGEQFINALLDSLDGLTRFGPDYISDAEMKSLMLKINNLAKNASTNKANFSTPTAAMKFLIEQYSAMDIEKLEFLQQLDFVAQYATENGEYKLTDADRAGIATKIADTKAKAADMQKRLDKMSGMMNISASNAKGNAEKSFNVAIRGFGSTTTLANLVNVIKTAHRKAGNSKSNLADSTDALLDAALAAANKTGITVKFIDPDDVSTYTEDAAKNIQSGVYGWYKANRNNSTIYLVKHPNLDIEVAAHEIVHAATARSVALAKVADSKTELGQAYTRLDDLRKEFAATLDENSPNILRYAAQDVDEFLAVGLTNPTVIEYLDTRITTDVGTRNTKTIGTLFKKFIKTALGVLYAITGRKLDNKVITAYEALVIDSAVLMNNNRDIDISKSALERTVFSPAKKAREDVSEFSPKQTFDVLDSGTNSKEHTEKLSRVISSIIEPLYNAADAAFTRSNKAGYTPEKLWNDALQDGKAPHTTAAIKAGFTLSDQEQMAVEAIELSVKKITERGSVNESYLALERAYTSAKNKVEPKDFHKGDWNTATAEAQEVAQAKYDHLFGKGTDYIARFAAMSIASEEVSNMLQMNIDPKVLIKSSADGSNKFEKLIGMINSITNEIALRTTANSARGAVNTAVTGLVRELAQSHMKARNKAVSTLEAAYTKTLNTADGLTDKARDKVASMIEESPIKMFNNRYVNTVRNSLGIIRETKDPMKIIDTVMDFRDQDKKNTRLGFRGELLNEISSSNPSKDEAVKLLSTAKQNESIAQRLRTTTKDNLKGLFKNLTPVASAAVTNVILNTDMQALYGQYGDKVMDLVSDRTLLIKEIGKAEATVNNPLRVRRAKDLAYYMVTGLGHDTLAKNAAMIAKDAGYTAEGEADANTVEIIDKLVSLYALQYTDAAARKEVTKLHKDNKGSISKLLQFHNSAVNDSMYGVFAANPDSYVKGYLPAIDNPNKEIVVANNKREIERYKAAMYVEVGSVTKYGNDPDQEEAKLYMAEDAFNQRFISGAVALSATNRRGSEIKMTKQQMNKATKDAYANLDLSPTYDPRKADNRKKRAIPSYDRDGFITGYNYEINRNTAKTILGRKETFEDTLAELHVRNNMDATKLSQNIDVMDSLIDHHAEAFKPSNAAEWVFVGEGVDDPNLAEYWGLLPKEIKNHVMERTGRQGVYVNNRALLSVFGLRKYSAVTIFDKQIEDTNFAERLYKDAMVGMFGNNARIRAASIGQVWGEAVKLLKDIVIIRNLSTSVMNVISNGMLLLSHGVPPNDIIKHSIEAVKAGGEYRQLSTSIVALQNAQRMGDTTKATADEIERLTQRVNRNPLIDLINAGMFAGIVEDVEGPNEYSFTSRMAEKYKAELDLIPPAATTVAKHLFVTPSTPIYKFLYASTQYGDFAAKYALYQYYTKKADTLLSHDDAIKKANENFINYDIPSSQGMQYLNDIGLVMFSKYNLRIQKALLELMSKKPATALINVLLAQLADSSWIRAGIDPMFINANGLPFRNGAFGLFGALDEPIPIKMIKQTFN